MDLPRPLTAASQPLGTLNALPSPFSAALMRHHADLEEPQYVSTSYQYSSPILPINRLAVFYFRAKLLAQSI